MPTVQGTEHRHENAVRHGPGTRRASVLHGRLRALGRDASGTDLVVAACLGWVADTLVEIADALGDPRSAGALVDEASAVLAAVPQGGRNSPAPVAWAEPLTEREHTVLLRLQDDVPLRQVGSDLFISHNTVKSHTRAVYRKLGVSSRTEALDRARQLRLL